MGWLNRNQKRWIPKHMRRKVNFPLIVGVIIVLLTVLVAVFGPQLAPRDPLEQNQITKVGSKYLIPPFPILTPGFPLGSDQLGRDILSGLLWSVRPTLLLVTFVALIRLLTGTVIGLLAGFQLGRFSRFLDTLISAAISVPTIIVALGCIAALGIDLGVWVFIVGLTLTGWVETARIVREQTNMIRGQVFVEAARSLGASEVSILFNHVLSQIMPMIWMLFAFEISSSLMLTASLGFLGYYVGGDVWVMVSDTTAIATSSMPELGQMLATTKTNLTKPWALFSLGGTIFLIVLGFTMLGEGLRNRLNRAGMEQSNRLAQWRENARFWVENSILHPVRKTIRRYPYLAVIAGCIILLAGTIILGTTLWGWYQNTYAEKTIPPSFVSQEAQWVSADHDAYGTLWSRATGPHSTDFAWALSIPGGIEEGPAIGADGTVYVTASEGELLALSPADGSIIWRCALPDVGIGAPGIDAEGTIYVADGDGGVSAIKPDGSLKWYYAPAAINSAETGPVVSRYGLIFYTVRGYLRTITNDGAFLWEAYLQDMEATRMPVRLSPDGSIVYTSNAAFSVLDGSKMAFPNLGDMDGYFTGADGELYAFSGHRILHWSNSTPEGEVKSILTWDFQKFTVSTGPHEAGAAPDGSFWMF